MLVWQAINTRLSSGNDNDGLDVELPRGLKTDRLSTRVTLLRRIRMHRARATGGRDDGHKGRTGADRLVSTSAPRQRVIVRGLASAHAGQGSRRLDALKNHIRYLGRSGARYEGERPIFFDRVDDNAAALQRVEEWREDPRHFRFMISPEHGDRITDMRDYVRTLFARVAGDLGEPELDWFAICHFDTSHPHSHVVLRGLKTNGRDLMIPKAYYTTGMRTTAEALAQERLGALRRGDPELRIWRDTKAEHFTELDRRLIAEAGSVGRVSDGVGGTDTWSALKRSRLQTLQRLGLAVRERDQFRLDQNLEERMRLLQPRQDLVRTLNQRRLASAREIRPLTAGRVRGHVVETGVHDERGLRAFVIVRDAAGVEHYASVPPGAPAMRLGARLEVAAGPPGIAHVVARQERGFSL
jgi:type IV secretory pathway VirD2 relaxase